MTDLSDAQATLLRALQQLPNQRATVDELCTRAQRRKTGLKKLEALGYVQITGTQPVYQSETDERVVTLTAEGKEKAAELAKEGGAQPPKRTADAAPPSAGSGQAAPAASAQREHKTLAAHTLKAEPAPASAMAEQAGTTGESKLDFLARRYLGRKVKIYADAIPATGTLTTIGTDFVHLVTDDGWDLVYDAADIEVTVFNRTVRECA